MKIELILRPVKVSGISKNHCPLCAGIAVRNQQESVSALSRNHCPEWANCAEWLAEFENVELSDELKSHLANCFDCAMEVLEIWNIIKCDTQGICSRFE